MYKCIEQGLLIAHKLLSKHSGIILTTLASAGVIVTSYLSVKAGTKAKEKEVKILEREPDISNKELTKEVAPCYIPAAISTIATIGVIISLYITDRKKQVALVAAFSAMSAKYQDYKARVKKEDPGTYEKLEKEELCNELFGEKVFRTVINMGERKIFWDPVTEKYFSASMEDVLYEISQINRMLHVNGEICVNEYLDFLGLPEEDWGWGLGWSEYVGEASYGYRWIDIVPEETEITVNGETKTIYKLWIPFMPHDDYLDDTSEA